MVRAKHTVVAKLNRNSERNEVEKMIWTVHLVRVQSHKVSQSMCHWNTLLSGRLTIPHDRNRTVQSHQFADSQDAKDPRIATSHLVIMTCHVGTLQPFVSHHAGEPASPHKVISYDCPLYVLRILRAALDLRRLQRSLEARRVVEST